MNRSSLAYKKAFTQYLRTGIPIALSLKRAQDTQYYIWRTVGDGRVRSAHAANNGKVFRWDNPPITGHPGSTWNCRCTAEPYYPKIQEDMRMDMYGISDAAKVWKDNLGGDFQHHYFHGNGKPIRLRDTGHLQNVVDEYWRLVKMRLLGQIADAARKKPGDSFSHKFGRTYPVKDIVFDLGRTTIGGIAKGSSELEESGALYLSGGCDFYLRDMFEDPLGLRFEIPFSTVYPIFDDWKATFSGRVEPNRDLSGYKYNV